MRAPKKDKEYDEEKKEEDLGQGFGSSTKAVTAPQPVLGNDLDAYLDELLASDDFKGVKDYGPKT